MKFIEYNGIFEKTTEYNYTPTPEELHFWYSGTNSGLTPDNPYNRSSGMSVTMVRYTRVSPTTRII